MTIRPTAAPGAERVSTARTLFAEIDRTCRTLRANPCNEALERRCVEALARVAAACLARGPIECRLANGRVLLDGALILDPRDERGPFAMLAEAGVLAVRLEAPIAALDNLTALVELLGHRVEEAGEIARRVWSASIPGLALRQTEAFAEQGSSATSLQRLAQLQAGTPPPALSATIEREIAAEPAVRAVDALLQRLGDGREPRTDDLDFVAQLLVDALDELEIGRAARIITAVERCARLAPGEVEALREQARHTCDPAWWQQVAEAAHDQDQIALSAFLLQVGVDREAADRILTFGAPAAVLALLRTAPEAPSTDAIRTAIEQRAELVDAAALRHLLADRTESV